MGRGGEGGDREGRGVEGREGVGRDGGEKNVASAQPARTDELKKARQKARCKLTALEMGTSYNRDWSSESILGPWQEGNDTALARS